MSPRSERRRRASIDDRHDARSLERFGRRGVRARATRRGGSRRPCRRCRRCRSCGRCRRRRGRATASARSRACPRARARGGRRASSRSGRSRFRRAARRRSRTRRTRRRRLRAARPDSVDSTLYTMPARRAPDRALPHSSRAWPRSWSCRRRSRGTADFCPGEPHSPNAHRVHDAFIFVSIFTGVIFVARRGRADRVHHQVPARQARAHGRGTADPRRDAARDHLDGRPGA